MINKEVLIELIETSEVEVHLMEKGYVVGIAKLILVDGLMEWNAWRILKSKHDETSLWVSYPSYKPGDSGKVMYFTDTEIKELIDVKIVTAYEETKLKKEAGEIEF